MLPVPAAILDNELTHPKAQAWLLEHWGLTEAPRQVVVLPQARAGIVELEVRTVQLGDGGHQR